MRKIVIKARGSGNAVYDVTIDTAHPRKSACNCPFAEGRRVICKHMIALDLGIFPEKEQQMMDYIEEQNQLYEQEYEQEMQEREEEIREYVMKLSKAELRQLLIWSRLLIIFRIRKRPMAMFWWAV